MNLPLQKAIKDLLAFRSLSSNSIDSLISQSELVTFEIGQPLSSSKVLQNKIYLILEGKVRLLGDYRNESFSISKLEYGQFVGLASFLRAAPCEDTIASSEVKALAIPDTLLLKLYQEESKFKNWCDLNIMLVEKYELIKSIVNKSALQNYDLKDLINTYSEKIQPYQKFKSNEKERFIFLAASSNLNEYDLYALIPNIRDITIRPPLNKRILFLNEKDYQFILNPNSQQKKLSTASSKENKIVFNEKIVSNNSNAEISGLDLGQGNTNKKFKLIKAEGTMQETLACLRMLANEMDLPFRRDSVEKILRDVVRDGKQPSMDICGGIVSMLGLNASIANVSAKYATRLQIPCLVKWRNSFALVRKSNANGILISSPKDGEINLNINEIEEEFKDGINVMLVERSSMTPEKKFGINWFWPALKRYKGSLTQVLIASFIVQLFGLANPLLIQVIIDKVISQRSLDTLQILGVALIVVTILGGVISSLRTFLFTETTNRIDIKLASEIIDHLLRLPLKYFDKRPVGELSSRIAELETIRNFLTGQALTTILDAAFSIIYIIVMSIYSWLLTIIALIVVPIQIALTLIGTPLIRRQIRDIASQNAKTQSHLVEVITGVQTVKAQNVEIVSRWRWQDLYSKYISRTFSKTLTGTALGETSQVLQQLSQLLVLWIGATLVLKGQMTLGQLIAFRIISSYVTQPLLRLSTIWQNIQEIKVSFERLADIVDTPEESNEADKANIPLPTLKGEVEFKDVSFKFSKTSINVLKNINLKIESGKFVGIVGRSGSGKSTLMKLLPRLYKNDSGTILIDKYDINKVELYSLRRQIGIVPQEPLLFAGTISENISLTDQNATSEEIVNAAKIADAHNFIMELPDGYSTNVGERGSGLSGGQKQRIAIARTIISNPNLLILDEATSALDYSTERTVCENLRSKCKGSTVFFITHRLSTIKNADQIVMLNDGFIDEMGTHNELMNNKASYYALYKQQESN